MLIEEAVYAVLSNNDAIKEIAGANIYPVTIPQHEKGKTLYPAVVFTLVNRQREQTHQGPSKLVKSDYIVSCLAPTYFGIAAPLTLGVKQLADRVRLALNGKSGELMAKYAEEALVKGVFLTDESDDYVKDEIEELDLYHVPQSYTIQHWETLA